jgi:hypothetical protein
MTVQLINIPFTKTDGVHKLRDALNLTQSEIDALGDAGIEAMKQQRFDNWVAFITAPSPEAEPETEEQIDG